MWLGRRYALALLTTAAATASCNFILGVGYDFEGKGGAASTSSGTGGATTTSSSSSSGQTGGTGGTGGVEAKQGEAVWAFALGSSGDDTVNAIAVTQPMGHVYLTGKTGGSGDLGCTTLADGGATGAGGYLIEVDETGKCVWGLFFGSGAEGTGVAVDDSQKVILVGTFASELKLPGYSDSKAAKSGFVACLDFQTKNLSWRHVFSTDSPSEVTVSAVAADAQAAYIGGHMNGTLYTDGATSATTTGDEDGFIMKCANMPGGSCSKFVSITGDPMTKQEVLGLARSPDGSQVAIAGMSEGDTGFGDTMHVAPDASANAIFAGFDTGNAAAQGDHIFGDDKLQSALRVAYGSSGASPLFLAGKFDGMFSFGAQSVFNTGGQDLFFARFNAGETDAASVTQLGNDVADTNDIGGMVVDASSNLFVVGTLRGPASVVGTTSLQAASKGGDDAFVLRLDENLTPIWFMRYGDTDNQGADAVTFAKDGDLLVAGHFHGAIDMGAGHALQATAGGSDLFLAKIKP